MLNEEGGFFPVPSILLRSPSWLLLNHGARSVYLEFRREWSQRTHNDYSKVFVLPYSQIPFQPRTVSMAVKRLKALGLLKQREEDHGGLYNAHRYLMSEDWRHYKPTEAEAQRLRRLGSARRQQSEKARARLAQATKERETPLHFAHACAAPCAGSADLARQDAAVRSTATEEHDSDANSRSDRAAGPDRGGIAL